MTKTHLNLIHPKYRPDIDGLRAIAILSVVLFHAFPTWMRGGFIGVDVFFVISGFLISTLIFENLDRGTFNFAEFYARRIKRIFPALLLVLIASYAFGWFALLADEYKQLGKHMAGGAGFVSNLVLWSEAGYFDNSAETKPLLHLWSLGIEEQFYIVWPFVLWLAWKKKFNLLTLTVIVSLVSFYLNLKGIKNDAIATFYSPLTRFWELLSGSILAWFALYKKDIFASYKLRIDCLLAKVVYRETVEADGKTLSNLFSCVGSLLLIYGLLRITKDVNFPGKWAVIPVLGAVLIILAGPQAWINRMILSHKVVVWFGLISFPLYLWHWSILSFLKITAHVNYILSFSVVLCSVLLSWLTYRFLEHPIRTSKQGGIKVITLILLMLIVGSLGLYLYSHDGISQRYDNNNLQIKTDPIYSLFDEKGNLIEKRVRKIEKCQPIAGVQDSWCRTSQSPVTILFGDSHADHLLEEFYDTGHPILSRIKSIGAGNCPPFIGAGERCDLQVSVALPKILSDSTIRYVILSSWNTVVSSNPNSFEGLSKTISAIRDSGKKIIFIVDVPTLKFKPHLCVAQPLYLREILRDKFLPCEAVDSKYYENRKTYDLLIDKLKYNHPEVIFFDTAKLFSDSGVYKARLNNILLYGDEGHLSAYGRYLLVSDLLNELNAKTY